MAFKPSSPQIHPSRLQNIPKPKKSRRKPSHAASDDPTSARQTIGALRNAIRNLTRLLQHNTALPADVRWEKERALAHHEAQLADALEERRISARIGRYHKVRFFERQKATRALKKSRAKMAGLKDGEDGLEEARRECHEREVDLNYTLYFPLAEKYWSLYPKSGDGGGDVEDKDGKVHRAGAGDEMDQGKDNAEDEAERDDEIDRAEANGAHEEKRQMANPSAKKPLSTKDGPQNVPPSGRRSEMWYCIERAMEEGAGALEAVRNWRPNTRPRRSKRQGNATDHARGKTGRKADEAAEPVRRRAEDGGGNGAAADDAWADGEGSDGGFFED